MQALRQRLDQTFGRRVTSWQVQPARKARFDHWPHDLDPRVIQAASALGLEQPFSHQAAAMEEVLRGRSVVLATPTASGKSIAYVAPTLHHLLRDPGATALYLFPTKALAQDQLSALQRFMAALPGGSPEETLSWAATYDGDTPRTVRRLVREKTRVLLTNPDMLHAGILPSHPAWASFLKSLRLVVLDELHVYRGVFGSHVANVLRRLRRVHAFHSGEAPLPTVCCSATVANAAELAEQVIGQPVTCLSASEDGSPGSEHHHVFLGPQALERTGDAERPGLLQDAATVVQLLLGVGLQTLVFTRTRRTTELLQRELQSRWVDSAERPEIAAYRGGYRPEERRAIEQGLREGRIRVVVATSALELGVDIGSLAACVQVGYPGTIIGFHQQSGRVGRRGLAAVTVLVAGAGPLDRYLTSHPEFLFDRSPERAYLDPDSPLVLLAHLRCAAYELPLRFESTSDPYLAGPARRRETVGALLEVLTGEGALHRSDQKFHWIGAGFPAADVGLRTTSGSIQIQSEGRILGTVETAVAAEQLLPSAIYLHRGAAFEVASLDLKQGRALVTPVESSIYTVPEQQVELAITRKAQERETPGATVGWGDLEVKARTVGLRRLHLHTGELVDLEEVAGPESSLQTAGYFITLHRDVIAALREQGWWRAPPVGYRGPDWQAQRRRARERDRYVCRQCGAPEADDRQHDIHHLRPFRDFGYVPGVNLAFREANRLDNLVTLCRVCHARAESVERFGNALSRLGYVLGHVAPLLLLCDARDLGRHARVAEAPEEPSGLIVYEQTPGGVGFGEALFQSHEQLLDLAGDLVLSCGCQSGCPACVGPPAGERDRPRTRTIAILDLLTSGGAPA